MHFRELHDPWVGDTTTHFHYDIQRCGYFLCKSRRFADAWLEAAVFIQEKEYDPAWVELKITPILESKLDVGNAYAFGGLADHPRLTW